MAAGADIGVLVACIDANAVVDIFARVRLVAAVAAHGLEREIDFGDRAIRLSERQREIAKDAVANVAAFGNHLDLFVTVTRPLLSSVTSAWKLRMTSAAAAGSAAKRRKRNAVRTEIGAKVPLWPAGHLPHKGGEDSWRALHVSLPRPRVDRVTHPRSMGSLLDGKACRSASPPLWGRWRQPEGESNPLTNERGSSETVHAIPPFNETIPPCVQTSRRVSRAHPSNSDRSWRRRTGSRWRFPMSSDLQARSSWRCGDRRTCR